MERGRLEIVSRNKKQRKGAVRSLFTEVQYCRVRDTEEVEKAEGWAEDWRWFCDIPQHNYQLWICVCVSVCVLQALP